jgi:hypothetical protein
MTPANDFLQRAAMHMRNRASTYDKPEGERSMAKATEMFNAATGHNLTTSEGWLMMMFLKISRNQAKGGHQDSLEDLVAYAALYAEEELRDEKCASVTRGQNYKQSELPNA